MVDMMYLRYTMTESEYNVAFKQLQSYLSRKFPNYNLRKEKGFQHSYITNALARFGFQEIRLRNSAWGYRFMEIRLRPQLLIDREKGYYRLTKISEFKAVRLGFNYVLQDILSLPVPDFFSWKAIRVEAAADIRIDEELIFKYLFLFKKGNVPDYFLQNEQSQRYWYSETNVYWMSPNKTINWYNRYDTLKDKESKSGKNYLDYSETRGILRFETQVRDGDERVKDILKRERLQQEVMKFYKLIVGEGDYYTRQAAEEMIYNSGLTHRKRILMIRLLRAIDDIGSIFEAKKMYLSNRNGRSAADDFSKNLNHLRRLGINPVCMPREWGMIRLENLYNRIEESFKE